MKKEKFQNKDFTKLELVLPNDTVAVSVTYIYHPNEHLPELNMGVKTIDSEELDSRKIIYCNENNEDELPRRP